MANRFLDTNFYKSPFVRGLKGPLKALYSYIICDCDGAGIWNIDLEIANLYIGFQVSAEEFDENFVKKGKAIEIGGGKYFFPDFIEHQYPSGLQENNKAHKNFINTLRKYDLLNEDLSIKTKAPSKPLQSPLKGGQGNGNGNGQGNGNGPEEGGMGETNQPPPVIEAQPEDLTKQMVSIYKKYYPTYRENIHGDTMWCGNIARFIANDMRWPQESITNGKMNDVLAIWEQSLCKAQENQYWYSKTIKMLSEYDTWHQFSKFVNFKSNATRKPTFVAGKDDPTADKF